MWVSSLLLAPSDNELGLCVFEYDGITMKDTTVQYPVDGEHLIVNAGSVVYHSHTDLVKRSCCTSPHWVKM